MKIVRVLSGGAAQGLVEALRPSFEATTGAAIEGIFGAVGAMQARLLAGEPADVMILSRALIDGLARDGQVLALSAKDIGAVQTAVAVRSSDSPPAVGSAAELRAALLAADSIHFPDPEQSTAGIHFAKVLKDLGIWDEVAEPAAAGAQRGHRHARTGGRDGQPAHRLHPGHRDSRHTGHRPRGAAAGGMRPGDGLYLRHCHEEPAPAEAAELIASLTGEAGRELPPSARIRLIRTDQVTARIGLTIVSPAKSLSLSVATTQSFASAIAAIIMSSALRGRPVAVPPAIKRAQMSAAFSSKGSTRPANRAGGPVGPENQLSSSRRFRPAGRSSTPRLTSAMVSEEMNKSSSVCAAIHPTSAGEGTGFTMLLMMLVSSR